MNDPNQDPNKPRNDAVFYKPSPKLLSIRNKGPPLGLPNPAAAATQTQARRIEESASRSHSEDKKSTLKPNPKNARQRDQSYDPSKDTGMEEEPGHRLKKRQPTNNLLTQPKDKKGEKTMGGINKQKITTKTDRVFYGGHTLKNYDQGQKKETDLFGSNLQDIDVYKGRKFLFPIDVKIKTAEKEDEPKPTMLVESQEQKVIESKKERTIMETLNDEFCFFQLPANLPLEGCAQATPKIENTDMEVNADNLLSSFLNHKFDSTGFHLERDFKILTGKEKEKMVEEKSDKKMKDKAPEDKLYETYHIGKLYRMKNGQIKMKIGNNLFDVDEGVQDSFYKELFAIDYNDKVANSLFPIEKKFVIKPDMESFY